MKESKKPYLMCRAADNIPFALMWKRKIPEAINTDPAFTIQVCDDLVDGLIKLYGAIANNSNKISLIVPPTYSFDMLDGYSVAYHIAEFTRDYDTNKSYRYESYESMGELISICGLYARCVIRLYNYSIYAEREIPLDEIRDAISFAETLNDRVFRNKYGIFCVTEDHSQAKVKYFRTILYFDASHLIEVRATKVEEIK